MIKFDKEFFNIKDTLLCGQLFRYEKKENGYAVRSGDKLCRLFYEGDKTVIESEDDAYFADYFDLSRDYSRIFEFALSQKDDFLTAAAQKGKGIRILNQDAYEALVSFIISQNNNIKRIKASVEKLCEGYGKRSKNGFAFPTKEELLSADVDFYRSIGLGYRAKYLADNIPKFDNAYFERLKKLDSDSLFNELVALKGVGCKVADCAMLFGFSRRERFPVDTWIEKVYKEDFSGALTSRKKITEYFENTFGEYSGYIQQYVFYFKRGNR